MLALLGCAVAVCATNQAWAVDDSAGTPYQGIVERNVFALKPPTPPPPPEEHRPPPPKIYLTGITTILGKKLALLKFQAPAKPGVKVEEEGYTLSVGQRVEDVEVLDIDEKAGIVKVNDYGTITNLSFENNGVKAAAAPPPAPAAPGAPPPNPAFTPAQPGTVPHGPNRTVPTYRPMRSTSNTGGANYGAAPASYGGSPGYGGVGTPNGTVTMPGLGQAASPITATKNWPPETTDPDAQTAMDILYQQKNAPAIANGTMPDIPGLPTTTGQNQNNGATTQNPNRNTLPRAPSLPQVPPY